MSTAIYAKAVSFLRSSLDAKPDACRHPVARPRKEVPLPELVPVNKWLLIGTVALPVHMAVLTTFGIAWALTILFLSYLTAGAVALAARRFLGHREAAGGRPRAAQREASPT